MRKIQPKLVAGFLFVGSLEVQIGVDGSGQEMDGGHFWPSSPSDRLAKFISLPGGRHLRHCAGVWLHAFIRGSCFGDCDYGDGFAVRDRCDSPWKPVGCDRRAFSAGRGNRPAAVSAPMMRTRYRCTSAAVRMGQRRGWAAHRNFTVRPVTRHLSPGQAYVSTLPLRGACISGIPPSGGLPDELPAAAFCEQASVGTMKADCCAANLPPQRRRRICSLPLFYALVASAERAMRCTVRVSTG